MRMWSSRAARLALVAGLAVVASGCAYYDMFQAQLAFRDANQAYATGNNAEAAEFYEQVLAGNPDLAPAYFFLANSLDQQFRPARRGEPANDALIEEAIANYRLAAEHPLQTPELRQLSLEYLVAAYGPEKMNAPAQAEPIVLRMIDLDPQNEANYFVLAQIYEDAGAYDLAENALNQARQARPDSADVYLRLAGFYSRQGDFPGVVEALEARIGQQPNNPEAHHALSQYYWDEVFSNFRLTDDQRMEYVLAGIESSDRALALNPNYAEAVTFKELLLRRQALLVDNFGQAQQLLAEAEVLNARATELRAIQQGGGPQASAAPGAEPAQ
jgi:tetratricopeptide (TPR) repeat protein